MSIGIGFLKSLIQEKKDFLILLNYNITEEDFLEKEKDVFRHIKDYYLAYSRYPQFLTVEVELGLQGIFERLPEEPFEFWLNKLKQRRKKIILQELNNQIKEKLLKDDIQDIEGILINTAIFIEQQNEKKEFFNIKDLVPEVIKDHDCARDFIQKDFISLGFPYLDTICGGGRKGDIVVVVGEAGCGKTFCLLNMAYNAHVQEKCKVLFVSTEMTKLQIARRLMAIAGQINTNYLKMGDVSDFKKRDLINKINEEFNDFYILDSGLCSYIENLQAYIVNYKPDVVYIDGAYLLRTYTKYNQRWERIMTIYEILKNIAMKYNVLIVTTHQYDSQHANEFGGMAGSKQALQQIPSIVLSFEYVEKQDRLSKNLIQQRKMVILKGRDGETGSILLEYNMVTSRIKQSEVLVGSYFYEINKEYFSSEKTENIETEEEDLNYYEI